MKRRKIGSSSEMEDVILRNYTGKYAGLSITLPVDMIALLTQIAEKNKASFSFTVCYFIHQGMTRLKEIDAKETGSIQNKFQKPLSAKEKIVEKEK